MPEPSNAPYTLPQIAELLDVNPSTVRWWVKDGRLQAHKQGRAWLVERDIIDAMVANGTRPQPPTHNEPEPVLDLGPDDPRRPDRRVSRAIERH
jgi:excisionase family DNA binding protein